MMKMKTEEDKLEKEKLEIEKKEREILQLTQTLK
jgi:hypothetical protein